MNYLVRYVGGIILLSAVISTGRAQEYKSLNTFATYELMEDMNLWLQSNNAAGALIDSARNFTKLIGNYESYQGTFHRPQQGESGNNTGYTAEGALLLDKYYVWGYFNYSHDVVKGANYNASILDPYRGMPYFVADTNKSNWRNQYYELKFKVATPRYKGFSFGLEGSYDAAIGAKQRDIRAKTLFYFLSLKPGVVYSFNENHHIGVNGIYYNIKEESSMSNVNTYFDQQYFELYGLGTSIQGLGSGRTTNYVGSAWGGGLQYNYNGFVNMLVEANYEVKNEDADIGFSTPKKDAAVKDKLLEGKLTVYTKIRNLNHRLSVDFANRKIDGIQHVTRFNSSLENRGWEVVSSSVRSRYTTNRLNADYSLFTEKGAEYDWLIGTDVYYEAKDDVYFTPHSFKNISNLFVGIKGKKNFFLSEKLLRRLFIELNLGYNKNLSGEYGYNGQYPDTPIVLDFERIDMDYLTSDFYSTDISVVYSQKIRNQLKANAFIKLNFQYMQTPNTNFDNRRYLNVSLGANF